MSMFFFITLYLQQVLGYSAIEAGLAYLPLAVSIIIASGVASQLVTRLGFAPVLAIGMTLITAALLWFSQVSVDGGYASDVLGPSLLATIANSRTDDLMAGGDSAPLATALTEGFQAAFLGGAAIAALGLALTLVLIRSRDSRAHVELGDARTDERPAEAEAALT